MTSPSLLGKFTAGPAKTRGITLVETFMVMAIVAIAASMAVPMIAGSARRRQFEGIVSELVADLRYARSEAVARHRPVVVSFEADGHRSCYSVHTGPSAACHCLEGSGQQPSACDMGAMDLKTVRFPDAGFVKLQANNPALTFSPTSGAAAPGTTLALYGPQDVQVRHIVSLTGRVRSCVAAGTTSLSYAAC